MERLVEGKHLPDLFLVATCATDIGRLDWQAPGQWSGTASLLALSETTEEQEALWLLPPFAWIRTRRNVCVLRTNSVEQRGVLIRVADGQEAVAE